jgi:hypothetical protein
LHDHTQNTRFPDQRPSRCSVSNGKTFKTDFPAWLDAADCAGPYGNVPSALKTYEPDVVPPSATGIGDGIPPPRKVGRRLDSNYRHITCRLYEVCIQDVTLVFLSLVEIESYSWRTDPRVIIAHHVIGGHNVKKSPSITD